MTAPEFKAWFEGFTEAISGQPNKKQWARIKERVAELNDTLSWPYWSPWYISYTLPSAPPEPIQMSPTWTLQDNTRWYLANPTEIGRDEAANL